jgi:hypothetical protein
MVYETLGKVSDLQVLESATGKNEVRLHGVFGVCGVRNNNKRVYNKQNYGMMVEALQNVIANEGCPGELEHPNTMNITLENVSHKIESIEMNEDGTITGTILLLNTPKGQIAKAIVEGGLPLYISSRGAGSIDEAGNVTLSTIKTYDLVGTPGFSQAKLSLKENQTYECLNESAEDGNIMFAIVENDEFGHDPNEKKEEKPADLLNSTGSDSKEDQKSDEGEEKKDDASDEKKDSEGEGDGDDTNNDDDINMKDLKEAIDKLTEKVTSLEAELHVAKESLEPKYAAIEQWIKEEFAPEFKKQTLTEMAQFVEGWICEEFAPEVQNWVCEEFAPEVQNWVCEEFAPEVQTWVTEEFAPEVQNWVCEEFAPEVQGWVTEEFAPTIEGWLNDEYTPEAVNEAVNSKITELETRINENVSAFLEAKKDERFIGIDKMIESLEGLDNEAEILEKLTEAQKQDTTFAGYFAVENMPAQYRPMWESLTTDRKIEIARQSKMYDFTKMGILESFWAGVKFENNKQVNESVDVVGNYHSGIAAQMRKMMHK